jgi:hypothetical protein
LNGRRFRLGERFLNYGFHKWEYIPLTRNGHGFLGEPRNHSKSGLPERSAEVKEEAEGRGTRSRALRHTARSQQRSVRFEPKNHLLTIWTAILLGFASKPASGLILIKSTALKMQTFGPFEQ